MPDFFIVSSLPADASAICLISPLLERPTLVGELSMDGMGITSVNLIADMRGLVAWLAGYVGDV